MSWFEAFTAGARLACGAYEHALAEVERQGTRRSRLVSALRARARTELEVKAFSVVAAAAAMGLNEFPENADAATASFNYAFPLLLQRVGTLTEKEDLLHKFEKMVEPAGRKLCQYCGRLLEPGENLRDETCPPPARCRKGLQNRRGYTRRKSEIMNL